MAKTKLFLAVNPSKSYLSFLRDKKLKEWGFGGATPKLVSSLGLVGVVDLFGGATQSLLVANDKASIDRLLSELEDLDGDSAAKKFNHGLVILSNYPANSSKKLQERVRALGGEVDAQNKTELNSMAKNLLADLAIRSEVRDFLLDWAGEDPENIIGVVRFIADLSPEKQKKVSIEIVLMQLSLDEGALSAFELEKPVLAGDAAEAIRIYRRMSKMSLKVFSVLFRKIQTLYKAAYLQEIDPKITEDQLTSALALPGRSVKFTKPTARRLGKDRLGEALEVLIELENDLKTGAPRIEARFEIALYRICEILCSR